MSIFRLRSMICCRAAARGFCLFLLPQLAVAQTLQSPYTIYGRVVQPDDSPAVHAVVKLTDQIGMNRQVYTDESGRFEIRDVPRGRFYLTAVNPSAPSQVADTVMVDLTLWAGKLAEANIYLRIRTPKAADGQGRGGVVSVGEEIHNVPRPARKAFEQAVKLRKKGKYSASVAEFTRSIELFPAYFQAFAARGEVFLTLDRPPEAAKDFARALELNSRYGPALRGSAMCDFQRGGYTEAIRGFKLAADAEPGNAVNYYFLGVSCVALDRRDQARAALLKSLALDPVGSARAHMHLATLLIRERRAQEAIAEIEAYLKAVPEPPDVETLRTILARLRTGSSP